MPQKTRDLLNKDLPAWPLAWPPGWPRTGAEERLTPKEHNNSFILARDYLLNSLRSLRADNVLVSTNVPLTLDGNPYLMYADKPLDDPGVAVYFYINKTPYAIACDIWEYPKDNMRAIATSLNHLHALEKTGSPHIMLKALKAYCIEEEKVAPREKEEAAPKNQYEDESHRTIAWWDVLRVNRQASLTEVEAAFRSLARKAHPDRGGSPREMAELNAAISEARTELKSKSSLPWQ